MKRSLAILTFIAALVSFGCSPEPTETVANAQDAPIPLASEPAIATAPLPQFVNLGADKCVPCRQMIPVRREIAEEYAGKLEVSFIDVWADREAGSRYGIRIIPTQIILDANGEELFRHEGFWPKKDVIDTFENIDLFAPQNTDNTIEHS